MAKEELLLRLQKSLPAWNEWRQNVDVEIDLFDAVLQGAHLAGADLRNAKLKGADLGGADLRNANLKGANMDDSDLRNANLEGADLSGAELSRASLKDANLRSADLSNARLFDTELTGANLRFAHLTDAILSRADLTDASLVEAFVQGTRLYSTNLTRADMKNAQLFVATLYSVDMTSTDLTQAFLGDTTIADVDLSHTVGLNECQHTSSSVIDIRTLMRSGNLPISFLRGCGLPDGLIAYLPSLLEVSPIQFYSLFISYSTANQDFAERLHADLQAKGVRCWFAPHHMEPGKKIHEQIDAAIRIYDKLLLILSKESMASTWVKTEIAKARKKERDQDRRVLFPIRLVSFDDVRTWEQFDADLGDDSAKEIREYYLPDFSEWKNHDIYSREFQKLLDALKSDAKPTH